MTDTESIARAAELTPALFDTDAVAYAHASWTWAMRLDAIAATASLRRLTDAQLRDVELARDLHTSLIAAVRGQRRAALAEAILTPDAVSGGVA